MLSPILVSPDRLTVDPLLLAVAGRPLTDAAGALRQALPGVNVAWCAAAQALHARRTGESLQACQPGMQRVLAGCVEELEAFGQALKASSAVYTAADSAAVDGDAVAVSAVSH